MTDSNVPQKCISDVFTEYFVRCFSEQREILELRDLHALIISEVERPLIQQVLNATRGNQSKAAEILGINRNTLRKKIDSLKMNV